MMQHLFFLQGRHRQILVRRSASQEQIMLTTSQGGGPMTLLVRTLTTEDRTKIEHLVRSRSAPVRLAQRAWMIKLADEGQTAPSIATRLDVIDATVRRWIKRFNRDGLIGLEDAPRSGRPYTYDETERSRVSAKARGLPPKPEGTDVPPTCHWTLDQLQEELHKDGVPIKRSQIRRVLRAEHVKWQKPRTWLESDDPQFAEKRGRSFSSTRTRRMAVPS